jgi:hypothetical protein
VKRRRDTRHSVCLERPEKEDNDGACVSVFCSHVNAVTNQQTSVSIPHFKELLVLCHTAVKDVPMKTMMNAPRCNSMAATCVQVLQRLPSIPLLVDVSADLHSNQTILRQRFTMRRYNPEHDGRLTNLAKAIE